MSTILLSILGIIYSKNVIYLKIIHMFFSELKIYFMDCSIVIADQYYENKCYHVTMASASEEKDLMISCQHFVDSHVLEASATQMTHYIIYRV